MELLIYIIIKIKKKLFLLSPLFSSFFCCVFLLLLCSNLPLQLSIIISRGHQSPPGKSKKKEGDEMTWITMAT